MKTTDNKLLALIIGYISLILFLDVNAFKPIYIYPIYNIVSHIVNNVNIYDCKVYVNVQKRRKYTICSDGAQIDSRQSCGQWRTENGQEGFEYLSS